MHDLFDLKGEIAVVLGERRSRRGMPSYGLVWRPSVGRRPQRGARQGARQGHRRCGGTAMLVPAEGTHHASARQVPETIKGKWGPGQRPVNGAGGNKNEADDSAPGGDFCKSCARAGERCSI